jgi:NadR type nicotinamide-nucleotide adenylyltransferase
MHKVQTLKKIAILGPESSGKTTLCMQLAAHFNTQWVPEYARSYIPALDHPYKQEDILFCAKEQLRKEEELAITAHQFLFCDTELIIAKVWSMDVYKSCDPWILGKIVSHKYDFFLLTAPDLPFEQDPVRENPHRREELFAIYENELRGYGFPYAVVSGMGKKRLQMALRIISHSA